jgi:hypothetical protein
MEIQSLSLPHDSAAYIVDWGDATVHDTSDFCGYMTEAEFRHTYADSGDYAIRARAWDGVETSNWSADYEVTARPFLPGRPRTPIGRDTVPVGDTARYATMCYHPLLEPVAYQFDWGDSLGEYGELVYQGELFGTNHVWLAPGDLSVRVRARDTTGAESGWSDAVPVAVIPGRR